MIETSSSVPRKSSAIFGHFREMFGNVRVTFGQVLKNLSEIFEKWSEIIGKSSKSRHQCVYTVESRFLEPPGETQIREIGGKITVFD